VLVALVQGVVGPFNEDPCPFDEAGRKESGEGADEDFLEEGGVHPCLPATKVPAAKVFTNCFASVSSGTEVAEFSVMADSAEPKPNEIDADNLSRLLELELIQKRATWKQAGERYRSICTAGFVFLFVLIVGCLIGFSLLSPGSTNNGQINQQLPPRIVDVDLTAS